MFDGLANPILAHFLINYSYEISVNIQYIISFILFYIEKHPYATLFIGLYSLINALYQPFKLDQLFNGTGADGLPMLYRFRIEIENLIILFITFIYSFSLFL